MKKLVLLSMVVFALFAAAVSASVTCSPTQMGIAVTKITIDGIETGSMPLDTLKEQKVTATVEFIGEENLSNVEISAYISGYEHNTAERLADHTSVFDVEAGVIYSKHFSISLPVNLALDSYKLRFLFTDRKSQELQCYSNLMIDTQRHSLDVKDFLYSPTPAKAGRAMLSTARIWNKGQKDEEGVKVSVSIADLGISASDYMDLIRSGETLSLKDLYMRIPDCAKAGTYSAKVSVSYNDGFTQTVESFPVQVEVGDTCNQVPVIAKEESNLNVKVCCNGKPCAANAPSCTVDLVQSQPSEPAKKGFLDAFSPIEVGLAIAVVILIIVNLVLAFQRIGEKEQ